MIALDDKKVEQIVHSFQLPPKPEILEYLQQEQAKEYPDLNQIADLIAADVGLSAYVLKTINSPAFGLNRTITDIRQSVMLLGLNAIGQIIPFHKLRESTLNRKASISMERFWDTAVEMANLMVRLQRHLNLKIPPEDAYSAGLFHENGIALLATRFMDYKNVLQESNTTGALLPDLEEQYYNTNHATVGYFVASSWNLPVQTCQLILRHHDQTLLEDESTPPEVRSLFVLLKLAENILTEFRRHSESPDWCWAASGVRYYLGISEQDYFELKADMFDQLEML